jgi:hypothetical protein
VPIHADIREQHMSYADSVARVAQIQGELAAMRTAFDPTRAPAATPQSSPGNFADALAQAQASGPTAQTASAGSASSPLASGAAEAASGAPLSASARGQLTGAQQQFASRLAADTGLSPQVVAAWLLAEESGEAAKSREASNNNDWLNIGYTDSGTYGSSDSVWSNPAGAADATAGWLKGQNTIPGYGTASSGIQAILRTAGQSPEAQIASIQQSGWASSGYPDLPSLYQQVG